MDVVESRLLLATVSLRATKAACFHKEDGTLGDEVHLSPEPGAVRGSTGLGLLEKTARLLHVVVVKLVLNHESGGPRLESILALADGLLGIDDNAKDGSDLSETSKRLGDIVATSSPEVPKLREAARTSERRTVEVCADSAAIVMSRVQARRTRRSQVARRGHDDDDE